MNNSENFNQKASSLIITLVFFYLNLKNIYWQKNFKKKLDQKNLLKYKPSLFAILSDNQPILNLN
jgi:hypothetical protein